MIKKNKIIIEIICIVAILLFSANIVNAMKVFNIEIYVDNNNSINIVSVLINPSEYVDEDVNGSFVIKISDSGNNILSDISFEPSFLILSDPPTEVNSTIVSLNLPYFENAKTLKVYYKNEEKLSLDISDLLCNNNQICDGSENYLSCSDCEINASDGVCINAGENENKSYWEDGICDPDCYLDNDCYNSGLNIGDTSKEVRIYKEENGSIYTTILCNGDCSNVQAELIQESVQLSPDENLITRLINRIKKLFGITGKVILNPEIKDCGNMTSETCQLSWDVSGDKAGEYSYYVKVTSSEKDVNSDLIGLTVLSPETETTPEIIPTPGGGSGGGGGGSSGGGTSITTTQNNNQQNQTQIQTETETPENQLTETQEKTMKKTQNYLIYGIILVLVMIIAIVVYLRRKR